VDTGKIESILLNIDKERLLKLGSLNELVDYILDFFSDQMFLKEKFEKLLILLTIT
jgi:hypothetical protein